MTRGLAIGLKQVVPPSWFRSLVFHVLLRYLPNTLQIGDEDWGSFDQAQAEKQQEVV